MASVAAIILAAGFSRGHQSGDKLLRHYRGMPLLLHAIDCVVASSFDSAYLVVQDANGDLAALIGNRDICAVECPEAVDGMGASLAKGVAALRADVDGVAIFLGDMPEVDHATVATLIACFAATPDRIVRPVFDGAPGHPVIFPSLLFPALRRLSGDVGAREIIRQNPSVNCPVNDSGVILDLDDDAAFERFR